MVVTKRGLRQSFVLSFLHVQSRRVICSPATYKPDQQWMVAQAEVLLEQARDSNLPIRYLVRDNDGCYVREFDGVFKNAGVAVEPTAPRAPNQNAYVERWIGSLQLECLDRFWVFGLDHLDYITSEFVGYYNELRPHQRKDNKPLLGVWSKEDDPPRNDEQIACRTRLGGVLKHYERIAA